MGFLGFWRVSLPPLTVLTHTTLSFYYLGNSYYIQVLFFDIAFRFDNILDLKKLCRALSQLLELGDWQKYSI